jgi:hypothetical protein
MRRYIALEVLAKSRLAPATTHADDTSEPQEVTAIAITAYGLTKDHVVTSSSTTIPDLATDSRPLPG